MGFPESVEVAALAACERCCCICHKFCGTKIELHHIKQKADGGEDTFENCIPLCFDCHADMGKADPRHPKGKHYSAKELIQHRDNWYEKVRNSREGIKEVTKEDIEKLFADDVIVLDGGNAMGHNGKCHTTSGNAINIGGAKAALEEFAKHLPKVEMGEKSPYINNDEDYPEENSFARYDGVGKKIEII